MTDPMRAPFGFSSNQNKFGGPQDFNKMDHGLAGAKRIKPIKKLSPIKHEVGTKGMAQEMDVSQVMAMRSGSKELRVSK